MLPGVVKRGTIEPMASRVSRAVSYERKELGHNVLQPKHSSWIVR